jgi:hypothetical protein
MLRLSALLSSLLLLATLSSAAETTSYTIHERDEITTSPTKDIHARDTIVATLARRDDCTGSECTMTVSA